MVMTGDQLRQHKMQSFDEIIGFLIILLVIFFPLIRKILVAKAKKKEAQRSPREIKEEIEAEQEVREYVKRFIPPPPQPKKPSPPPSSLIPKRTVGKGFAFHSDMEDYKRKISIEKRRLRTQRGPKFKETVVSRDLAPAEQIISRKTGLSRFERILSGPASPKKMVILHEIFKKPKGL